VQLKKETNRIDTQHTNDVITTGFNPSLLQNIYTGNFIFETLNIENGIIKRDKFHLNRILFSIDKLKWFKTIDNYDIEEWWNFFLLNRITNIKQQTRGKLILIPDKSTLIPQFEIFEFPKYKDTYNLTLNHEFVRHSKDFFWQIKTGSYSRNIYYSKNKPENIDDFIFYNEQNNICETIFSNIYLKINNQLITPKSESGVLKGTFREYLLNEKHIKINNKKYQIVEENINISELNENSELFISNSLSELRKAIFIK